MRIPVTFTESECSFAPQFGAVVQIGAEPEPQKMEVHKITMPDLITGAGTKWLENNAFIQKHYKEPGFMVQLISLQAHSTDAYTIGYAYNGNRILYANDVCGVSNNISASGNHGTRTATGNCYTVNYNGIPYVTSDGAVITCNGGNNGIIKAGDYLLILSVAEV